MGLDSVRKYEHLNHENFKSKWVLNKPAGLALTNSYINSFVIFMFLSPTNALLHYTYKMLKYTVKISRYCSYMFRSIWTIIREPMPNLAKVTILCNKEVHL